MITFFHKTWRVFLLVLLFVVLIPLSSVNAQNTCECFCTGVAGVTKEGQASPSDCSNLCQSKGENLAVCASSPASYPANSNIRCFTADSCAKQDGVWDADQARDCPQGMHYCYAGETPVDLNISIGGTKTVRNIGQYINVLYIFLLGASIAIAVVMLMIGGLQYTLGAASPAQIEKAKERIRNAVIGLVLLMLSALLLETVNPQLKKLTPPQFPVIRRIELLSGSDSCETLINDRGYKIDEQSIVQGSLAQRGKNLCGSVAVVLETSNGDKVPDGTTCTFSKCPDTADSCFGQGEKASCVSCREVVPGNELNIKPSSKVCSSLQKEDRYSPAANGQPSQVSQKNYCFWTQDPNAVYSTAEAALIVIPPAKAAYSTFIASSETIEFISTGSCVELNLNCSQITKCEDYDNQKVHSDLVDGWVGNGDELDDFEPGWLSGDLDIERVCYDDPCGVHLKQGEKAACVFKNNRDCITIKESNIGVSPTEEEVANWLEKNALPYIPDIFK